MISHINRCDCFKKLYNSPLVRSFFHQNAQAPYSFLQLLDSSILALELSVLGSKIYPLAGKTSKKKKLSFFEKVPH